MKLCIIKYVSPSYFSRIISFDLDFVQFIQRTKPRPRPSRRLFPSFPNYKAPLSPAVFIGGGFDLANIEKTLEKYEIPNNS